MLKYDQLDEMSEDLIEIITSLTINGELSEWLLKLCRLSTREEEGILKKKYREFGHILPEQIGVESYFTLNNSSRIVKIFEDFQAKNNKKKQNTTSTQPSAKVASTKDTETSQGSSDRF